MLSCVHAFVCPHGHSRMQRQQPAGASDDARPSMPWARQPAASFSLGVLKKLSCSHPNSTALVFAPLAFCARSGLTTNVANASFRKASRSRDYAGRSDLIECAMPYCRIAKGSWVIPCVESFSDKGTVGPIHTISRP
jgi:hypothetical protein